MLFRDLRQSRVNVSNLLGNRCQSFFDLLQPDVIGLTASIAQRRQLRPLLRQFDLFRYQPGFLERRRA